MANALSVALNMTSVTGSQSVANGITSIEAYNLVCRGTTSTAVATRAILQKHSGNTRRLSNWTLGTLSHGRSWLEPTRTQGAAGNERPRGASDGSGRCSTGIDNRSELRDCLLRSRKHLVLYCRGLVGARAAYERALALDSHGEIGDSAQNNILDIEAFSSGRFDDVIAWNRGYLERNPLDAANIWSLAFYQRMAGQLDNSAITFRKLLDMNPAYATAHAGYGLTLLLMGKNSEALAVAQKDSDDEVGISPQPALTGPWVDVPNPI